MKKWPPKYNGSSIQNTGQTSVKFLQLNLAHLYI